MDEKDIKQLRALLASQVLGPPRKDLVAEEIEPGVVQIRDSRGPKILMSTADYFAVRGESMKIKDLPPDRVRHYLEEDDEFCLFCGSHDIGMDTIEFEKVLILARVTCHNCGKSWWAEHRLNNVQDDVNGVKAEDVADAAIAEKALEKINEHPEKLLRGQKLENIFRKYLLEDEELGQFFASGVPLIFNITMPNEDQTVKEPVFLMRARLITMENDPRIVRLLFDKRLETIGHTVKLSTSVQEVTLHFAKPKKIVVRDPVRQGDDGKWYHSDELWSKELGPFNTREIAEAECKFYFEYLNGPKPCARCGSASTTRVDPEKFGKNHYCHNCREFFSGEEPPDARQTTTE